MANLIVIAGSQAVGKMTVAEALRDKLDYRMMTNHDSIEISKNKGTVALTIENR